jgi:hypothetical protein
MPATVELRLHSNSGELLHVATCHAGKISVLRASSLGELRPYQRALCGSNAKDNLEILVDGSAYQSEDHTAIGFGEPSPTVGLTVRQFLISSGISDLSINTQLLSIGLEEISDKRCGELSLDQDARLRLLAASADADKVLILNDPFENISSKWRERVAEILATFAKSRGALIIIPSLSYRPDAWIENDAVIRIEVGQTSQKTIGFGSVGSLDNAALEEIRQKLMGGHNSARHGGAAAGLAAGIAGGIKTSDLSSEITAPTAKSSSLFTAAKLIFTLIGSSVGGWALYTAVNQMMETNKTPQAPKAIVANALKNTSPADTNSLKNTEPGTTKGSDNKVTVADTTPSKANIKTATASADLYVLDTYPAVVKASILDTARGITGFQPSGELPPSALPANKKRADSGNLFSLLAAASDSKSKDASLNGGNQAYMNDRSGDDDEAEFDEEPEPDPTTMNAEEAQREQIRQRFLEAIRASAARRQTEAEELE